MTTIKEVPTKAKETAIQAHAGLKTLSVHDWASIITITTFGVWLIEKIRKKK